MTNFSSEENASCVSVDEGVQVWRLKFEWETDGPDTQTIEDNEGNRFSVNHSIVGVSAKSDDAEPPLHRNGVGLYLYDLGVYREGEQEMVDEKLLSLQHEKMRSLQSGDIVELRLDLDKRVVSFAINAGLELGPVKVPEGELVPFVDLYGSGARASFV